MRKATSILFLVVAVYGQMALAQNTKAQATTQTHTAAPAGAQRGAGGGGGRTAAPATGITGVPRYRAGFRGPRGTTAPASTATVNTVGDVDANGKPDSAIELPGIAGFRTNALGIKAGTPIQVKVNQPVDSGHARNGDVVHGTLLAPVGSVPAGAPVELTVVATAGAGQMSSAGELSVQVVRINGNDALSQIVTAIGEEGKKVTADAAPERGTEAILTPDKPLTLPAA